MNSIEDMQVFKLAHKLTLKLYKLNRLFPKKEKFGLTNQVRRSDARICADLMEGSHRNNSKEYRQFAGIYRGAVGELKYHLYISKRFKL